MDFRHEWKHEIRYSDLLALRSRLSAVMETDPHALNGKYEIRSLYFDNLADKALREKVDGVNCREKFRIRYYNGDTALIFLEKKYKENGLCQKNHVLLSMDEIKAIETGDISAMEESGKELLRELCLKMTWEGLRPKTIVDYTREPFIYEAGNVRVTLDYNLRTGMAATDFLNPGCITIPVRDAPPILEVKWDEFLPSLIRDIVQIPGTHSSAFSKYAACRIYG